MAGWRDNDGKVRGDGGINTAVLSGVPVLKGSPSTGDKLREDGHKKMYLNPDDPCSLSHFPPLAHSENVCPLPLSTESCLLIGLPAPDRIMTAVT